MVAPSAPALAAPYPITRRRVTLPLYQKSSAPACFLPLSDIALSSLCRLRTQCGGRAGIRPPSIPASDDSQKSRLQQAALFDANLPPFQAPWTYFRHWLGRRPLRLIG